MEYISAEEFLKQPVEVQEMFVDWWKPSIGDLFSWIKKDNGYEHDLRKLECCNSNNIVEMTNSFKGIDDGDRIPLLTEGQLRKFIEDKTKSRVYINFSNNSYYIGLWNEENMINNFRNLGTNLFQAYWKVACQIASKED